MCYIQVQFCFLFYAKLEKNFSILPYGEQVYSLGNNKTQLIHYLHNFLLQIRWCKLSRQSKLASINTISDHKPQWFYANLNADCCAWNMSRLICSSIPLNAIGAYIQSSLELKICMHNWERKVKISFVVVHISMVGIC